MLLTITCKGEYASKLSFLLHKNPYKVQEFNVIMGKAYIFYPKVSDTETTVALLVDLNPIDLVKGKEGIKQDSYYTLFDYINDKPYSINSFTSSIISNVFNTACAGKCETYPDLVKTELDLSCILYALHIKGKLDIVNKIFEPLGYEVSYEEKILDTEFEDFGKSQYIDLTIHNEHITLSNLLNQLRILIPIFDKERHYYVDEREVDKLIRLSIDWLKDHPEKNRIVGRYFSKDKKLAIKALEALKIDEIKDDIEDVNSETTIEKKVRLNDQRLETIKRTILENKCKSVLDYGCGEGNLEYVLANETSIENIIYADVSLKSLNNTRIKLYSIDGSLRERYHILHSSLLYRDERCRHFDCICLIEVIEHIEKNRLDTIIENIFGYYKPKVVIITTPNIEYNVKYEFLKEGSLRYSDHRFEFTRDEFYKFVDDIVNNDRYPYNAIIDPIGEIDDELGSPTLMATFYKND